MTAALEFQMANKETGWLSASLIIFVFQVSFTDLTKCLNHVLILIQGFLPNLACFILLKHIMFIF